MTVTSPVNDTHCLPTHDTYSIVANWLQALHTASGVQDRELASQLFVEDGWWRDLLSLDWEFRSVCGADGIADLLAESDFGSIRIREDFIPRIIDADPERPCIEALFDFETPVGHGRGVVRIVEVDTTWKALTLLTTLHDLQGREQRRGNNRPVRIPEDRLCATENWSDRRQRKVEFEEESPKVVVIGGGHNGLMTAAQLGFWGVDTLVLEKSARIGDNWRNRYRSLVLHDAIWADHFPGMSFPDSWPVYMPKDKLADWLEFYSSAMEINVWTESELIESSYDDDSALWTVVVRRGDGTVRTLHPSDVVVATGVHGEPRLPEFPGRELYCGKVVHSSHYRGDETEPGDKAVIVGAGNSAHDAAQNLHLNGVDTTMVQRSSTYVISQETNFSQTIGRLYHEGGMPTEYADLIQACTPNLLALERAVKMTERMADLDRDMLDSLERVGYRADMGIDGAGALSKIFSGPGGYYVDVGCVELIANGEVKLTHAEVERFTERGLAFTDGTELDADLVVLATGYKNMRETARRILGDNAADRCDPVWGLSDDGEISGMWRRSGHPGLWFQGGPLHMARFYSRFLAIQLHALDAGLMPRVGK
ncbi:putative flavoprotein involved in K+ transport [Rhodococcus sp. 27YEA15]|uniref:flavin-containing monooxygenase n=1 Tax=Rhodococcus sp. 27YEA15 TaxID=3156259 RepID=UPI003C7A5DB1